MQPPFDIHAEQCALGAAALDTEALHILRSQCQPEMFYSLAHQSIAEAMYALDDADRPVELVTLKNQLEKDKNLDDVGGVAYLGEVLESVVTSASAEYYVDIVVENHCRREALQIGRQAEKARNAGEDVAALLGTIRQRAEAIQGMLTPDTQSLKDTIADVCDEMDRRQKGEIVDLQLGIKPYDKHLGGLPNELLLIGARPSVGKTSLLLNILKHVCVDGNGRAYFASAEMSRKQVVQNMLCLIGRVPSHHLKRGLNASDYQHWETAKDQLAESHIEIDDKHNHIEDIVARAEVLHDREPLSLVAVDYCQLLNVRIKCESRRLALEHISHETKRLQKSLGVPVIACVQLNRSSQSGGEGRKPTMADIKGSGAFEQDADQILLLWDPGRIGKDSEKTNQRILRVEKNRNGPTANWEFTFNAKYFHFEAKNECTGESSGEDSQRATQGDTEPASQDTRAGQDNQGTQTRLDGGKDTTVGGETHTEWDVPDDEIPF